MLLARLRNQFQKDATFRQGLVLAGICLLAYVPFIPWLGFYGDDWGYTWLLFRHGTLEPFLRNNRFGFIPVYDALGVILGPHPWTWQVFMVSLRWLCGMGFWLILKRCWPKQDRYTIPASILFVLYPGFLLHFAAFNLSAHFIALACFVFSIWFNQCYLENNRHRWIYLVAGLLLAAANLYLTEYFFFLELMRPVLLMITSRNAVSTWRQAFRQMIPAWIPNLVVFLVMIGWRQVSQSQINSFHSLKLLDAIRSDPFPAMWAQFIQMISDIWTSGVVVFIHTLLPGELFQNRDSWQLIAYILAIILLTGAIYLWAQKQPWMSEKQPERIGLAWIFTGILWSVMGGWAIWLAMLRINGEIINSRFTLPFMPGAVLLVVGIVQILFRRWQKVETMLLCLLISGSILFQNLVANEYRRDWSNLSSYFHQLTWRFPDLEPGTMLILSDNPMKYGEENSLSAATNWVYDTASGIDLDYYVYFIPGKYDSDIPPMQPGETKLKGHLVGQFNASYEKMVVLQFDQRGCIRTLYPDLDPTNGKYSEFIRRQTALSHPESVLRSDILSRNNQVNLTFGRLPETGWCWLYQRADLLAQTDKWEQIVSISANLNPAEYSHDEQKLMVFIRANLEIGDASKADSYSAGNQVLRQRV